MSGETTSAAIRSGVARALGAVVTERGGGQGT